ncbi:hypothetical protein [Bacillus sp. OTU530]|uniref:hypothetical protein n=1 Tax=Bacillus sp. OTU530 TaxID=3043862 RepID=UPI00313E6E8E
MKFTGFYAIVLYFYIIFALAMLLTIAISHFRLRNKMEKENRQVLKMKMWLFPYLTYVTIFGIVVFLISMASIDSMRSQLVLTMLITALHRKKVLAIETSCSIFTVCMA